MQSYALEIMFEYFEFFMFIRINITLRFRLTITRFLLNGTQTFDYACKIHNTRTKIVPANIIVAKGIQAFRFFFPNIFLSYRLKNIILQRRQMAVRTGREIFDGMPFL